VPLDATVATRIAAPRPNLAAGRTAFTWSDEVRGTPNGDAPSILDSSYTFTAEVDILQGGARRHDRDRGRVRWEGADVLTPGKHTLEFDFKYDGLGAGALAFNNVRRHRSRRHRHAQGRRQRNGAANHGAHHPAHHAMGRELRHCADTGTPVTDDYQVPFRFTGKLDKLTLKIDRPKLMPEDIEKLKEATRNNRAAE
jgi:arylsulfatase